MPLPRYAQTAYADETATGGVDANIAESATTSSENHSLIAQSEADGTCAPGEALVVYHASGASKGSAGTLSIQSIEDPLSSAGFTASDAWDFSAADNSDSAAADGALSIQSEKTESTIASGSDVRIALVKRNGISVTDLVTQLESLDFVECAQPNYTYEVSSLTNDTFLDQMYGLTSSTAGVSESTALSQDTTSSTTVGENVVAILDTGVDYTNPDLKNQMWNNPGNLGLGDADTHGYNGYANTYDPMPGSLGTHAAHGTHCAGIAAAQSNNAEGITGVAGANSHTKIMGLRVTDDFGSSFYSSAITACYEYLVKAKLAGVNITAVNNSWGAPGSSFYDPVFDYVVNQAGKAGVLTILAAGNDNLSTQNQFKTNQLESPYAISVASSNYLNGLSNFSNWHETGIDVAAPGSNILSTVPNKFSHSYFSAYLSKAAGKNLDYYTDIAEQVGGSNNFKVVLTDSAGVPYSNPEVQQALKSEVSTDFAQPLTSGTTALKITINYDALAELEINSTKAYATVTWNVDNTNLFYGKTDLQAKDYAAAVSIGTDITDPTLAAMASEDLLTPSGSSLVTKQTVSKQSDSIVLRDNYEIHGGTLTSTDTVDSTLTAKVQVSFFDTTGANVAGTRSCSITGYGIGRATDPTAADETDKTDFVPYAYMSGTSMAAPMITGCVGELAVLYPNYTPLQLRGLICGATDPLTVSATDSSQAAKHIASDGRFSFADAVDNDKVNATTWSVTTTEPTAASTSVTLHGYNLNRATVSVDGTKVETSAVTSQTADAVTITMPATLLNGKAHRFDVTDTLTGRTYNATYTMPNKSASSLVRVKDLPTSDNAGTGKLVSAIDRLFYADGNGTFLYSCTDPSDATSAWTKLAAPGTPWNNASASNNRTVISYAYANGKLYAFTTDDVAATSAEAEQVVLFCSEYDIAANAWTGFTKIGANTCDVLAGLGVGAYNGTVYAVLSGAYTATKPSTEAHILCTRAPGAQTFVQASIPSTPDTFSNGTQVFPVTGHVYGVGFNINATSGTSIYTPTTYTLDLSNSTIAPLSSVSGYSTTDNLFRLASYYTKVQAPTGNGIVVAGDTDFGLGDLQLIDTANAIAMDLGSFGLASADGLTVGGMTMLGDRLYLNCVDHATESGSATGLYTLPASAAAKLTATDVTLTATATSGGTATVQDWRAATAQTLSVRDGDTATWTAMADSDHVFAGWFDTAGNLISSDAAYTAAADADATLTARFTTTRVTRLWGDSALDTMSEIVGDAGYTPGGTVVLATSAGYWDALTASGIAGLAGAPVLLSDPSSLSTQTKVLLEKLRPSKIIVCGGTGAMPDKVVSAAASAAGTSPTIVRCAGDSAVGTANDIYAKASFATGKKFGTTAFVATGADYCDALACAPYAYAKGCPILLTSGKDSISSETLAAMRTGGIKDVYIAGGIAVVSDKVKAQLSEAGFTVKDRLWGDTAVDTSTAVAKFGLAHGMSADGLAVATTEGYWDALTGAALCGKRGSVLVLANEDNRTSIDAIAKPNKSSITIAYVFGGAGAVSDATKTYLETALK